jgi:predicted MFS family arabinose efflux permease
LVIFSNLIAAFSPNFEVMLFGRVLLGIGVGGLWSFAIAAARRLVPDNLGARATAVVSAGIGIGTVFGLPAGSAIGALLGWRGAFSSVAGFGVVVLISQLFLLPPLPSAAAARVLDFAALLRVPLARAGLFGTIVVVCGHFMAYTYLEPFLREVTQLLPFGVSGVFTVFAIAGILGSFSAELLGKYGFAKAVIIASALQAAGILVAAATGANLPITVLSIGIWGFAFGALPVCIQVWTYESAPALYESGGAMIVTFFQTGIALGALLGGMIVDSAGVIFTFLIAAVLSAVSILIFLPAARRVTK